MVAWLKKDSSPREPAQTQSITLIWPPSCVTTATDLRGGVAGLPAVACSIWVATAKAYSGLTDAEIQQVDNAVRKTTVEKFGPVRSVKPTMVFELGFEGIALSSRHKAGVAVRFPRILRRRDDKPVEEADTLDTLKGLRAADVATAQTL